MKTAKEVDATLESATKIAEKYGHSYISTEHFLLAILQGNFKKILVDFGVQVEELKLDLESHIVSTFDSNVRNAGIAKTQSLERVFNRALTSTLFSGRETLTLLD